MKAVREETGTIRGVPVVNIVGFVLGILALGVLPVLLGSSLSERLGAVGIFILMGLGLNIVVGYAGLLDLGYVAFFAVGAYLMALFTGANLVTSLGETAKPNFTLNLSFYSALPLVILAAAFVGLLIGAPVLRLRGDYLAIVTLGFGEIARVLVQSDWLKNALGGAQGLQSITDASLGFPKPVGHISFRNPEAFYWLVLGFCIIAVYVSRRLSVSRVGRAWNAMREDEQVAEAMGISTVKYKLLAFAMGAGVGCLSGALFAVKIGSLSAASFSIIVSITALAIIILGGMGSIPGVIVGGLVLIGVPAFLDEFEEFRLLLYGGVLVAVMILRPQGLIPNVRRSRELHEEEVEQDAWLKQAGGASADPAIAVGSTGPNPDPSVPS
jgi:branched-chain amino acid transport system permease protein